MNKKYISLILWGLIVINIFVTLKLRHGYHNYHRLSGHAEHFLCNGTIEFTWYTNNIKSSSFNENDLKYIKENNSITTRMLVDISFSLKRIASLQEHMVLMAEDLRGEKFDNIGKPLYDTIAFIEKDLNLQEDSSWSNREWNEGCYMLTENEEKTYPLTEEQKEFFISLYNNIKNYGTEVNNYLSLAYSYIPVGNDNNQYTTVYNINVESDEWIEFLRKLDKLNKELPIYK